MELIQQAGGRVHGCVDLHGWGERRACEEVPFSCPPASPITPSPPLRPAGHHLPRALGIAVGRSSPHHLRAQRGWEPVHCWVDWQTRREVPWRS